MSIESHGKASFGSRSSGNCRHYTSFGSNSIANSIFKHLNNIIIGYWSRLNFFIQYHVTQKKETRERRFKHFQKLIDEVFRPWIKSKAVLVDERDECTQSIIPLYVNKIDIIKEPIRSGQAISHLEHDDYEDARKSLKLFEEKCKRHNDNVANFMASIEQNISNSIPMLNQYALGSTIEDGYKMSHILTHYKKEIQGFHSRLKVSSYADKYKLHRESDNSTIIATHTNKSILDDVRDILEDNSEDSVVKRVHILEKSGNDICEIFNDGLTPEIRDIITEFEDTDELSGACGLRYCKK